MNSEPGPLKKLAINLRMPNHIAAIAQSIFFELPRFSNNIKTSKHYNPNSYEAKMIRSQIRAIEKELATINNAIADEQKFIKDYINGKDKMYKRLRAKSQ